MEQFQSQNAGFADFELLFESKSNDVIPVFKFKSKNTGLTVVLAQVEGPLVSGYFCLATEAHDDDGLPHTLEHLVFMGSEKYPFKGVLDLLANRCLASGTNAWTDTDHTCYTMTTAGTEGFLNLLPIYLDHVLYPTLTESAYVTEVHHINGSGEDAGVVYCEMQARENTGESLTHLNMLRNMYPGHCGYKSETGGILANLRTSTTHTKVVNYHQDFYRPDNLCLIITGQVQPMQVFAALKPFEDKIVSKGALPPYKRPWQSPVAPLDMSKEEVIPYPSDDEDFGMISVAWRGPFAKEQYWMSAVMIMMEYLTDTAIAPLQRDFVEIDDPFCSRVCYSIIENLESCVYITFQNVPKEKLTKVKDRLMDLLEKLVSGKEDLDMARMANVVHRRILDSMSNLEDQPHDTMAFIAIGDFLYGDSKEEFDERLNQLKSFRKLGSEDKSFWINLLNKYFVNKKSVTIVGRPSHVLMEQMGDTEKERVKKQQEALGKDGLGKKEKQLQKAIQDNEVEPPEQMVTSVDVPNVRSIHFHTIHPSSNHKGAAGNSNSRFPLADIPVTFQLDDMVTNFVAMEVLMDTACVPQPLRFYLPLYLEAILESPVLRNGVLVPHEDVVQELAADTVSNSAGLGTSGFRFNCGHFSSAACLSIKVELDRYVKGIQWLRELLYQTRFTSERLKIIATKMVNDVAQLKRKGRFVVQTLNKAILFNKESNHYVTSLMRQHTFLSGLLDKLDKEDQAKQVIQDLEDLRSALTKPSNIRIHMAARTESLTIIGDPHQPWQQNFLPKDLPIGVEKTEVHPDRTFLKPFSEGDSRGFIIGVGSVESSFLIQTTPCISSFDHKDLAAVMVFIQYLTQLEGPMWRQIRGLGLSYHYSMYTKPESGLLYFILYKSTHIVNAYKQARDILLGYLSGKTAFSEVELESSKSSLMFEIIEEEKTPSDASNQSLLSYLRGVSKDYNRKTIEQISLVTLDDLRRVGPLYLAPIFQPEKCKTSVVCHPNKVTEICSGFKELSQPLKVIESLEHPMLAGLD